MMDRFWQSLFLSDVPVSLGTTGYHRGLYCYTYPLTCKGWHWGHWLRNACHSLMTPHALTDSLGYGSTWGAILALLKLTAKLPLTSTVQVFSPGGIMVFGLSWLQTKSCWWAVGSIHKSFWSSFPYILWRNMTTVFQKSMWYLLGYRLIPVNSSCQEGVFFPHL